MELEAEELEAEERRMMGVPGQVLILVCSGTDSFELATSSAAHWPWMLESSWISVNLWLHMGE